MQTERLIEYIVFAVTNSQVRLGVFIYLFRLLHLSQNIAVAAPFENAYVRVLATTAQFWIRN